MHCFNVLTIIRAAWSALRRYELMPHVSERLKQMFKQISEVALRQTIESPKNISAAPAVHTH